MSIVTRFASTGDIAAYASGTGTVPVIETAAITCLDTDVLATSVISVGGNTQGTLYIDFTKGSLTNVTIKVYGSYVGSPTSSDWYSETQEVDSTGTATLYAYQIVMADTTAKYAWHFPIGAYRALKITVTGSGTQTGGILNLHLGVRSN
jgi:hypothetical protein